MIEWITANKLFNKLSCIRDNSGPIVNPMTANASRTLVQKPIWIKVHGRFIKPSFVAVRITMQNIITFSDAVTESRLSD